MKLLELAVKLDRNDIPVRVTDRKSGRVAFEGTAEQLLDYRKVSGLDIKNGVLCIEIKSNP